MKEIKEYLVVLNHEDGKIYKTEVKKNEHIYDTLVRMKLDGLKVEHMRTTDDNVYEQRNEDD